MPGSKHYPPRVRAALRSALAAHANGRSNAEVARELGFSGETIRKGLGGEVGKLLAEKLVAATNRSLHDIVRKFGEPGAENDLPPSAGELAEQTVEAKKRYTNAVLALRDLQEEGVDVPPDIAAEVMDGVALQSEEDPPRGTWRATFKQQLALRTSYREATIEQIRKHLGGVAVGTDAVANPRRGSA